MRKSAASAHESSHNMPATLLSYQSAVQLSSPSSSRTAATYASPPHSSPLPSVAHSSPPHSSPPASLLSSPTASPLSCLPEPTPVPKSIQVREIAFPESHPKMAGSHVPLGILVVYEDISWHPESAPECSPVSHLEPTQDIESSFP